MKWQYHLPVLMLAATLAACGSSPDSAGTIGSLSKRKLEVESRGAPTVEREEVIESYKAVLETQPRGELYQESLRRLADLNLSASQNAPGVATAGNDNRSKAQLNTAIGQYEHFLKKYPNSPNTEKIFYQLAKAYESAGQPAKALTTLDLLVQRYPNTASIDEVHFRRGETMFALGRFGDAARAYDTIVRKYPSSVYHERALYKYAWSEFKQGRHLDSLHAFFRILDDKLATDAAGKNLSRAEQEMLGDALRVVSLAFTYLHKEITPTAYFQRYGKRPYEPLIYENLGNLYLKKERIRDAADTYLAFTARHPDSVRSPEFHENAIKAYEAGGFASLIVPAKESFVRNYGIDSRFWKT
ncbi:MAG: tetratricopeptide repeat protein, partial [Pseudomonadota bacterium]